MRLAPSRACSFFSVATDNLGAVQNFNQGEALLSDWDGAGQRLSGLEGEAELFDQLAQRKALQAELDEVRVHRSRVRGLVGEWRTVASGPASTASRRSSSTTSSTSTTESGRGPPPISR